MGQGVDLEAERTEIRTLIDEADKSVSESASRVSQENFQLAKRGLIYWIDEVLTVAAPAWKAIILEWEYYSERERAWRFYVEGERSARHSSPDVTETWYLALALGFKGDIDYAFTTALKHPCPAARPIQTRPAAVGPPNCPGASAIRNHPISLPSRSTATSLRSKGAIGSTSASRSSSACPPPRPDSTGIRTSSQNRLGRPKSKSTLKERTALRAMRCTVINEPVIARPTLTAVRPSALSCDGRSTPIQGA